MKSLTEAERHSVDELRRSHYLERAQRKAKAAVDSRPDPATMNRSALLAELMSHVSEEFAKLSDDEIREAVSLARGRFDGAEDPLAVDDERASVCADLATLGVEYEADADLEDLKAQRDAALSVSTEPAPEPSPAPESPAPAEASQADPAPMPEPATEPAPAEVAARPVDDPVTPQHENLTAAQETALDRDGDGLAGGAPTGGNKKKSAG